MNATLVTALKNVLLNHLRDSGSGNATGNDDLQLLSKLLLQQPVSFTATPSPPHTPSPTLISGVRTPAGTTSSPLSRTSSGVSTVSDSSLSRTSSAVGSVSDSSRDPSSASRSSAISSQHEWDDNDNNDDDDDFVIKRRKPSPDQLKRDKRVVTRPVLAKLDAPYLAIHPRVQNSMFRKKFKRQHRDSTAP